MKERKTMTKIFNAIIVVIMIALIATFIVSAMAMQTKTNNILTAYSARREELAGRQQQIQDMIVSLNSTLQSEIANQRVLANELGVKINETVSAPKPVVNTTTTTTKPVVIPSPVVSTPKPRVTKPS
jgi:hypothetical protein